MGKEACVLKIASNIVGENIWTTPEERKNNQTEPSLEDLHPTQTYLKFVIL